MKSEEQSYQGCCVEMAEQHIEQDDNQHCVCHVKSQTRPVKRAQVLLGRSRSAVKHQGYHCQWLIVAGDGGRFENLGQELPGRGPGWVLHHLVVDKVLVVVKYKGLG